MPEFSPAPILALLTDVRERPILGYSVYRARTWQKPDGERWLPYSEVGWRATRTEAEAYVFDGEYRESHDFGMIVHITEPLPPSIETAPFAPYMLEGYDPEELCCFAELNNSDLELWGFRTVCANDRGGDGFVMEGHGYIIHGTTGDEFHVREWTQKDEDRIACDWSDSIREKAMDWCD